MAEKFIQLTRRDPEQFDTDTLRTVWLSRDKKIKAVMGELIDKSAMTIQSVLFDSAAWTAEKANAWIAEQNLENCFIKEILYEGVFPHPQDPEETITIDGEDIEKTEVETIRYLDAGGHIPLTKPPHPDAYIDPEGNIVTEEEDKIDKTVGYMEDVFATYTGGTARMYGVLIVNPTERRIRDWLLREKVKSVSPGIISNAVNAVGEFESLVDHVCITPRPHLIGQDAFKSLAASSWETATVFFEGHAMTFNHKGGSMEKLVETLRAELKKGFEEVKRFFSKQDSPDSDDQDAKKGEQDMKELEEAKKDLVARDKQIADLTAANKVLTDKIAAVETEQKQKDYEARKTALSLRLESLVKEGKVQPGKVPIAMAQFELLADKKEIKLEEGKDPVKIEDFIVASFSSETSAFIPTIKDADKTRADLKGSFDLRSPEGRDRFFNYVTAYQKENKLANYTEAYHEVLAKLEAGTLK